MGNRRLGLFRGVGPPTLAEKLGNKYVCGVREPELTHVSYVPLWAAPHRLGWIGV
jgi:hypothetical protein